MKCDEMLLLLNEYVDGDLPPGECEDLQRHLKGCNPCQVVIDNIRHTITICRDGEPLELPAPVRQRLHDCLRRHWQAKQASAGGAAA